MKTTADAVIIGAGIMGCAIAHALAERGLTDVVVLERDQIGRGATADAAGGVRQQFSTATNIRLATESVRVWETFPERFGRDIGLRQQGYLFLLSNPGEEAVFRANLALQQSLGVPARWVTPEEIAELDPHVVLDDIYGGTYCPEDGWCDTYGATIGFAQAARTLGVEIVEETFVTGIRVEADQVTGVETADGVVSAPLVIISAGPQTRGVGEMAGVELPVDPYRRMSFITEPLPALPQSLPMTIDFASGLYFHPESHGFLFGMANREEPSSFNKTNDAWFDTTKFSQPAAFTFGTCGSNTLRGPGQKTLNASVQSAAMGVAAFVGGQLVSRGPQGEVQHYWMAAIVGVVATLGSLWLAGRLTLHGAGAPPSGAAKN